MMNTETVNGVTVCLDHLPVRQIVDATPASTFLQLGPHWRLVAIQHALPGQMLEWVWLLHPNDRQARTMFISAMEDDYIVTVQGRFAENKYGLYAKLAQDTSLPSFLRRYVEHNESDS